MTSKVLFLFVATLLSLPASSAQQENWNVLPLSESGLNTSSYTAVVLSRAEEPGYVRELVRVQWRPGDPIDLYVVLPTAVPTPPAILFLYDYRFDTDRFRDDGWCKRMTAGGVAAVGFTSALSPQRFRNRPMKEWFVSELQESLATSVHDVQMILNYLESRRDIDTKRIGMLGQGSGGAVAILAAAVDTRISVVDTFNPWGDWPDWLKDSAQVPDSERAAYLTPDFLRKVAGMDPISYLPQLHLRALRVQQVLDDPVTPPTARDSIAAATRPPHVLTRYKNVQEHAASLRDLGVTGWIIAQLRTAGATSQPTK